MVLLKGGLLTACGLSFWPYLAAAGIKGQTGDYSHVFVIPLIALVVYLRSERGQPAPSRFGLAGGLIGCGLLLRGTGAWLDRPLIAEAAFPLLFIGLVDLLFGRTEARRITFPAIFLLFAFGFVTDILLALFVKYLMLVSAGAAYDAVTTVIPGHGPYIVAQNMIMVPPHSRYDVIEACAGIRGMLAVFVIGSIYGYSKKMNWREALRFVVLLTVLSLAVNLVRISATIVLSLLLRERCAYQAVHDTMNWVVLGPHILLIPLMAKRARAGRLRVGLIGIFAMAMVLTHAAQWHLRAAQGNARLLVQPAPTGEIGSVIEVDQQGVPRALLPYVSPEVGGRRYWRWILTSAMIHTNIAHLAVNVGLLLLLGHALGRDWRWPWMTCALLAGHVSGVLTAWLTLTPPPGTNTLVFVGASYAISGLFGAYLIANLLARRKWVQAPVFLAIYLVGLWLSGSALTLARQLAFGAHLAALTAGMAVAGLFTTVKAPKARGRHPTGTSPFPTPGSESTDAMS